MGLMRIVSSLGVFVLPIFFCVNAFAEYFGPSVIVTGGLGSNIDQFGIEYQDIKDIFPTKFGITSDGHIIIADPINQRIKVYDSGSALQKLILPQGLPQDVMQKFMHWPTKFFFVSDEIVLTLTGKYTQIYSLQSNLVGTFSYPAVKGSVIFMLEDGSFITQGAGDNYYKYTSNGQLIQSYSARPLELGKIETKANNGGFLQSIKLSDRVYSFTIPWQLLKSYKRDRTGNIVIAAQTDSKDIVYKISYCGKILGQMQIPADRAHIKEILGQEPIGELEYEYGQAIIAPNGDVYTWKRTPDNYSILKWTWVDDPSVPTGPDAPTGLTAMPSTSGIYLTWKASPQDPGCVTGYEIARTTTSGGTFTTLPPIEKGVVKYNDTTAEAGQQYYYKVRAKAGSEYSQYTSEIPARR